MTENHVLARLTGPPPPSGFVRRVTELAPGAALRYDPVHWTGAVVVVCSGAVQVRLRSGGQHRFGATDVLWLAGLAVLELVNPGPQPTVLVSVRRVADA